jgi:hypothetical protein
MIFAVFGFIGPEVGAIRQEGVNVMVILNALQAGHPLTAAHPQEPGRQISSRPYLRWRLDAVGKTKYEFAQSR